MEEIRTAEKAPEMASVRAYLSLMRQMECIIEPTMTSFLEQELVQARKQDNSMDAKTMSLWLTVSSFETGHETRPAWLTLKGIKLRLLTQLS